jgi:hypothetical protein
MEPPKIPWWVLVSSTCAEHGEYASWLDRALSVAVWVAVPGVLLGLLLRLVWR